MNCCVFLLKYEVVGGMEDGCLWILDVRFLRLVMNGDVGYFLKISEIWKLFLFLVWWIVDLSNLLFWVVVKLIYELLMKIFFFFGIYFGFFMMYVCIRDLGMRLCL